MAYIRPNKVRRLPENLELDNIDFINRSENKSLLTKLSKELLDYKEDLKLSKYAINHKIEKLTHSACSSYLIIIFDNDDFVPLKILDIDKNNIQFDFNNTKRTIPYIPKYIEKSGEAQNGQDVFADLLDFDISEDEQTVTNDFMKMVSKEFNWKHPIESLNYVGSIIIDIDEEGKESIREIFFNFIPNVDLLTQVVEKTYLDDDSENLGNNTLMDSDGRLYLETLKGCKYINNESRIEDINYNLTNAIAIISNLVFNESYPTYIFDDDVIRELEEIVELLKVHEVTGDKIVPIQTANLQLGEIVKLLDTKHKINLEGFLFKKK